MLNSEAIYNVCGSKTLISSLNRFGLAISYDELFRYHSDMASFVAEASQGQVPLPSHFNPSSFTLGAFDDFDQEEATLVGFFELVMTKNETSTPNMWIRNIYTSLFVYSK